MAQQEPIAHHQFLRTERAHLFLREVGDGPTIVVLHGGPDFDHSYLLPELDRLADTFRLVYYDQRGRGRSSDGVGPGDVTIESEIEDLDRVRQLLGLESMDVLGHSWGGLLAMEYAVRRPEHVSHLILMNSGPASASDMATLRRSLSNRRRREQSEAMRAIASSAAYLAGERDADAAFYRIHFASALPGPELLAELVGRLRSNVTADGIVLARQIEERLYDETWFREGYDLTPGLRTLQAPALVIHGDRDFIPVEIAGHIADALPRGRLVVLDDCGHFAFIEHPDRVHTLVADFVTA